MDDFEEKKQKKFVITRGMVLIVILLLVVLILLVVFLKPKGNSNKNSVSVSECKKLEERIVEEVPMYIFQKNIELSAEPIKIPLNELLRKNGGTIDENKYKATKICKGYAIASKTTKEEYKAYIACENVYTTKGYAEGDNNNVTTTTSGGTDTEKPVITLIGDAVMEIMVGDEYIEPGAKANDNIDGDITARIKISGSVNTSQAGEYVIKYSVMDKHSNVTEAERKVIVKGKTTTTTTTTTTSKNSSNGNTTTKKTTTSKNTPKTPPTIVLNGSSVININVGQAYKDPGYRATDCNGNDITSSVSISGGVDVTTSGTYTITYTVADKYGNSAAAKRTVIVNESTIEVKSISLTPNTFTISVGDTRKLQLSINPSNASNKNITWSSNDSSVATVSADGTVTGRKKGTATITARSQNGKTAISRVTVK